MVLVSNSTSKDMYSTEVYQSADNGKTFTLAGTALPPAFLGLTLDSAPSEPSRLYVSGRYGSPDFQGALLRSDDRGATWASIPIPGSSDISLPYIGAIDPTNPDVVYVRLDGDKTDKLVVTKDGGKTFTEVFSAKSLIGFALSPDGATVAAGSDKDGSGPRRRARSRSRRWRTSASAA